MDRRISSHDKHKFEEERARRILIHFFPQQYDQAQLSESPDIVCEPNGIGVEVTTSHKQHIQESMSRVCDISGKTINELSRPNMDNINSGRVDVKLLPNKQLLASFSFWGEDHDIIGAFLSKTNTLNKNVFRKFRENKLFIFSWMIGSDYLYRSLDLIISDNSILNMLADRYKYLFDTIFVFHESELAEVDLTQKEIIFREISRDELSCISHSSFKEIFKMTRDEFYHRNPNE